MRFETRDVVVRYASGLPPALAGVSMRTSSSSLYAVLGPNGSGKSTLLRALLGSIPVLSGSVTVDGKRVDDWSRRTLAQSVGVVTQREDVTFPITVRQLVSMGRYPHLGLLEREGPDDVQMVHDALLKCDALHLADREIGSLSGGEFQTVRIARALAQAPRALVLDEPTANLDIRHEMEILSLLRAAADDGLTVILVTHHLDLAARFADRLLLLHRGRAAAEGTAEEVLKEEVLSRVYEWNVAVRTNPITERLSVIPRSASRPRP